MTKTAASTTTLRGAARDFLMQENLGTAKFEVVPLLLPLSAMAAAVSHPLLAVIYAFVIIPLLDMWTGDDTSAAPSDPTRLSDDTKAHFRDLLKYYVLVHYTMLFTVMHVICTASPSRSALGLVGLVISLGVGASMSFTVAHELVHSTDDTERTLLSAVLLLPNFYMHWGRAHVQHHAHVGTAKDPTTSRKGETVYAFWIRSIVGNLRNAYSAEWKQRGKGRVATWIAAPSALLVVTYAAYGSLGAAVLLGQALVSVLMLETVNYIEHYGLVRENKGAVLPHHSWNSSTSFGNAVMFNLQRHSDHHASSGKPYFLLESIDDAPQLPAGYPAMMLLALLPGAWKAVMDGRIGATTTGEDLTKQKGE